MAQTRPSPTLSRGFTRLGRFLAPYGVDVVVWTALGSNFMQCKCEKFSIDAAKGASAINCCYPALISF